MNRPMQPAKRKTVVWPALTALVVLGACLAAVVMLGPKRTVDQGTVLVRTSVSGETYGQTGAEDASALAGTGDLPLWEVVDEAVDPLPRFSTRWSVEGRVLVNVSTATSRAGAWRIGDRLTLPLPQLGAVYRPRIEHIDDGPGPSRSVLGKVRSDDGLRRRFVVTVGPAHVLAYIDTPQGPYELVGDREFGWLLPTSSMMTGIDHSEPDYVLPDSGTRSGRP